jgi:hypothetical protein
VVPGGGDIEPPDTVIPLAASVGQAKVRSLSASNPMLPAAMALTLEAGLSHVAYR